MGINGKPSTCTRRLADSRNTRFPGWEVSNRTVGAEGKEARTLSGQARMRWERHWERFGYISRSPLLPQPTLPQRNLQFPHKVPLGAPVLCGQPNLLTDLFPWCSPSPRLPVTAGSGPKLAPGSSPMGRHRNDLVAWLCTRQSWEQGREARGGA